MIFSSINGISSNISSFTKQSTLKAGFIVNENQNFESVEKPTTQENKKETNEPEWYLEIPVINLKAEIAEGTTKEVMDKYIGHFEETKKDLGNIGLAAHNRGYENNYFENLKQLKEGDKIIYKYKNIKREYEVTKHIIIEDTDWTNLEDTEENTITLITCVENEPAYRRCIQGKVIEK